MCYEFACQQIPVRSQVVLPVVYKDHSVDAGYRLDLVVDEKVIVELKSIDQIEPIHTAQLLTYLKLSKLRLGFLINFNVTKIATGLKRYAL